MRCARCRPITTQQPSTRLTLNGRPDWHSLLRGGGNKNANAATPLAGYGHSLAITPLSPSCLRPFDDKPTIRTRCSDPDGVALALDRSDPWRSSTPPLVHHLLSPGILIMAAGTGDARLPLSLEAAKITSLPATSYYLPNFISEEEERVILDKVRPSPWLVLSNPALDLLRPC